MSIAVRDKNLLQLPHLTFYSLRKSVEIRPFSSEKVRDMLLGIWMDV